MRNSKGSECEPGGMSPNTGNPSASLPGTLPDALGEQLAELSEAELRSVIRYVESLLPPPPSVEDLLEEHPGEEILEVEEQDGYASVVKRQPCADGCDECPHGPYLYHVRVEKSPEDGEPPSLHWEFLGLVD